MAATAASSTTFHLNPPPNRHNSISKLPFLSLQRSRQPWPTQFPLISCSSSINFPNKLSRLPFGFTLCSASSQDETLVTEDENDVLVDDSLPPQEDAEDTTTEDDGDDSTESDGAASEESPVTILSSLQSYKEALADNNESKISEIETYLKSIEDEKLVLERKLATLSDELSTAKDRVLRISADFDNFRKRTERERISLVANAQGEVVENLLPVLDNFERAKAAIKVENEKEEKINDSYQSIYKQFVEILGSLGVVPVETTGQPFDPLLHEAIMREESTEFGEGVVIQEFRKGFRIGERLLRPSMVKVSAGPGPENTEPVSPSGPEAQAPGADSVEEPEEVDQSEPSPAQDE
ncbi:putative GrpE nucleotide exchange factor [Helianthus annuus]|nr:putative GrpE nucleotide exchange factor [Helianthus annuus]KAJ0933201.1 putative GrpE nucleotide exchange factor [Helianthus annuus]